MKKRLIAFSTLTAMICFSSLHGTDLGSTEAPSSTETSVTPAVEEEEVGTSVSPESNASKKAEKRKMWQNIGIAIGAVAIAVTALVLVSNHHGKKAGS